MISNKRNFVRFGLILSTQINMRFTDFTVQMSAACAAGAVNHKKALSSFC